MDTRSPLSRRRTLPGLEIGATGLLAGCLGAPRSDAGAVGTPTPAPTPDEAKPVDWADADVLDDLAWSSGRPLYLCTDVWNRRVVLMPDEIRIYRSPTVGPFRRVTDRRR